MQTTTFSPDENREVRAWLTRLNNGLKKRKRASLSRKEFAELINSATNTALRSTSVPGTDDIREACHDVLGTLFKRWIDPKTAWYYVNQLSTARMKTRFPAIRDEIGVIFSILDKEQRGAKPPKPKPNFKRLHR